MRLYVLVLIVLVGVQPVSADWWDSFTDSVSNVFSTVGKWFKTEASPTIREKFDAAKEKLKDPEFHKGYIEWTKEKLHDAKEFAEREIVPHVKDIYGAAKKALTSSDDVKFQTE